MDRVSYCGQLKSLFLKPERYRPQRVTHKSWRSMTNIIFLAHNAKSSETEKATLLSNVPFNKEKAAKN